MKWKTKYILALFVQRITQGIINTLVRCHLTSEDNHEDAVVVKIFADKSIPDREAEILGLQIAPSVDLGPCLEAIFDNGMVMQYVKGRPLAYTDYANSKIMK